MKRKIFLMLLVCFTVSVLGCKHEPDFDNTPNDPGLEHKHIEDAGTITQQATCQKAGVKTFKCKDCGEVLRTEEIPVQPHNYCEFEIDKIATETEMGTKHPKCCWCNLVDTETTLDSYGPYDATYKFTEAPVILPKGIDGTLGTGATYILFGDFPQNVVPQNAEGKEIIEGTDELLFFNPHPEMHGYVAGSDGNYYLKILEYAADGDSKYSVYHDGSKPGPRGIAGNEHVPAKERYFRVEPIKWCVIQENYKETGNALLLAENGLISNIPYYKYSKATDSLSERTIEGETVKHSNYKYSQVRAYLNGLSYYYNDSSQTEKKDYEDNGLLQIAFTEQARVKIADTKIEEHPEVSDKLLILRKEELPAIKPLRVRLPSDYNLATNGAISGDGDYTPPDDQAVGIYWFTRSIREKNKAYYIFNTGMVKDNYYTGESDISIVPALTIKLQ